MRSMYNVYVFENNFSGTLKITLSCGSNIIKYTKSLSLLFRITKMISRNFANFISVFFLFQIFDCTDGTHTYTNRKMILTITNVCVIGRINVKPFNEKIKRPDFIKH